MTFTPYRFKTFLPGVDDGYSLGTTSLRMRDGYFGHDVYSDGYVHTVGIKYSDGSTSTSSSGGGGGGSSSSGVSGSVQFSGGSGSFASDASNFFWDDTNNRLGIGDNNPAAKLSVVAGSITGRAVTVTATMSAAGGQTVNYFSTTGGGTGPKAGMAAELLSGYTSNSYTSALSLYNASAGTATGLWTNASNAFGNAGLSTAAVGSTAGHNAGVYATPEGSSSLNVGVFAFTTVAATGANVGIVGTSRNTTGIQLGGFFGLYNTDPTLVSAAIIADNANQTSPIFLARDNGTTVFSIADGGQTAVAIDGSASTPSLTFGTTADSDTGIFHPAADTLAWSTNGSEAARIDSSQNVLIGTTSPIGSGKLTIAKSSGVTRASLSTGSAAGDVNSVFLTRNAGVGGNAQFALARTADFLSSVSGLPTGTYGWIQSSNVNGIVINNNDNNGAIYIGAGNGNIATFQSTANGIDDGGMGIGFNPASTPTERLRIDTGAYSMDGLRVDINTSNAFNVTRLSGVQVNSANASRDFNVGASGVANALLVKGSSGNVDIGGTGAANKLTVSTDGSAGTPALAFGSSADSNTGIFHPAADTLAFSTNGSEAARIDSSGNVGIGTTSPVALLNARKDQNSATSFVFENRATGSAARTYILLGNSASEYGFLSYHNSGFTTTGLETALQGIITVSSGSTGGLLIFPQAGPLVLAQGASTTAAERMRISTTEVVFNDAAQSINFRVEGSTDQNSLFVQASTNKIGVGINSPSEKLTVSGVVAIAETTTPSATSGFGKFYPKSDGYAYFMGSSGTEHILTDSGTREEAYDPTVILDFSKSLQHYRTISLAGDVIFETINVTDGGALTLRIIAGDSFRGFTFPGWLFIGAPVPFGISANKIALLTLRSFGGSDADIVASFNVQA